MQEFLFGFLKSLLVSGGILLFVWTLAAGMMSGEAFMILSPFIIGPMIIGFWVIIVPIIVLLTFATIDRSSAEVFGALAVYPVLVAAFFGFRTVHSSLEKERVQTAIEAARAALDPKYLQRKIDNPIGKIETLALKGQDSCTTGICPIALADGMAERVAILGPPPGTILDNRYEDNPLKSETLWVEKTYRALQGKACLLPDSKHQVFWVQKVGLFGACIEKSDLEFPLEDAILVLDKSTSNVNRPNGLRGGDVSAAYQIKGKTLHEIARWEAGALSWHGSVVGERFETIDFLRSLTGSSPNRVGEAAKLTLPQRIDAAYGGIGKTRIDVGAVVAYLQSTPERNHLKTELDDERVSRLRALVMEGCPLKAKETSKNPYYMAQCRGSYDRFVDWYFGSATAAALKF
ncbi:hypothetical protein [Mesorhizobium sp. 10.2.3]|uniref:hypothetical protein n=3 Tax=Mesorhizobium TaxID=68287 RepID=UPI0010A96A50|nr:hypothetical protein [Mesorhizobium sp. 10.2.3]